MKNRFIETIAANFVLVLLFLPTTSQTPPSEDIKVLSEGQIIEREISPKQKHIYKIHLEANQFVKISAISRNCGIAVNIYEPDGKFMLDGINVSAANETETINTAVRKNGDYQISVVLADKTGGTYRLQITELRTANEKEFSYTDGKRIMSEMEILIKADSSFGNIQTAVKKYQEAIEKFQFAQAQKPEAVALDNIGILLTGLGERRKAIEFHQRSLQIFRTIGDKKNQSYALNSLGRVYAYLGERQKAIEILTESLSLAKEAKNKKTEGIALNGIGAIYYRLQDTARAESYHAAALKLFEETDDNYNQAITLNYLGNCANETKNFQKAVEYYEKAITLHKNLPGRQPEPSYFSNLGRSYFQLGNTDKGFEYLNEALKISQTQSDKSNEALFLKSLGEFYFKLGKLEEAAEFAEKSLEIYRTIEDPTRITKTLYLLTKIKSRRGKPDVAQIYIEEALNLIEGFRSEMTSNDLRDSFSTTIYDYYKAYIELLMQRQKIEPDKNFAELALQANERARARGLLNLLTESNIDIRQGVNESLLNKEKELGNSLTARLENLTKVLSKKSDTVKISELKNEIEQLRSDYEQTRAQRRRQSPRYSALTQPKTLPLNEIQKEVLDNDSVLLEYALGEEKSYLWIVSKDNFRTVELTAKSVIEKTARQFYEALTARNKQVEFETANERADRIFIADSDLHKFSKELSEQILAPALPFLENKRLLIVADGALQYIPFASLTVSDSKIESQKTRIKDRFLVEEHEIVNLPSASALAILRREMNGRPLATKTLAVLADPIFDKTDERFQLTAEKNNPKTEFVAVSQKHPRSREISGFDLPRLPFTRREADSISALISENQKEKKLDFAANRSSAMSPELAKFRYVHFATHGFINNENPELSGIVFSMIDENGKDQDGFLRVNDIFNLKLPAELVVLSGCRTGLGKEIRGEGLVGMTRGFMYAGARRVVVSLWDINDEGTSELMGNFYRQMFSKKLSPSSALRQSQISMLKDKRWQNPYFWATFTLQGEPK